MKITKTCIIDRDQRGGIEKYTVQIAHAENYQPLFVVRICRCFLLLIDYSASAKMKKICPLCGPSLSAFCMLMSVWGVIFLGLLGVFFHVQAVSLFPDLHFKEEGLDEHGLVPPMEKGDITDMYYEKASQCWIAAGLYLGTLVVVMWQNRWNRVQIF
ncbi:hypothetical protein QR680_003060 [Steinernema hermaphroditum]|uniref:Uncharacterized protein n=1 Tax=Steinernema hermaphroditum TaxID=289476 RepID=A0AA39H582_9BILA|nr:hypothetical protein QR680_003060 [Steinernema hermaphroditum]